jgi:short-chain Z-isoprenyl diphosphate synthase
MLRLLYWLYESRLRRQIRRHPVPRHVGIILDGNRRHARKHGLADPRAAYDLGAEKLDDVLAWCSDLAIPAVTLWVCSIDNLKRPQAEVAGILAAVEAKISALAKDPRFTDSAFASEQSDASISCHPGRDCASGG